MAKAVKLAKGREFSFKSAVGGAATASKYPWDDWFNGDLLLIERDVLEPTGEQDAEGNPVLRVKQKRDFDVEVNAIPGKIKTAARKRYKVVQVSRLDADGKKLADSLIIRARDMTADERDAEDLLRAEEKSEADARRAAKKAASGNGTTDPAAATASA